MARKHSLLSLRTVHNAALVVLGLVFLLTSLASLGLNYWKRWSAKSFKDYTYTFDDYPQYYPIDLPYVSLTPEDSLHYVMTTPEGLAEWDTIFPRGGGFVSIGPDQRVFGFSMYHQMHCLIRIRDAILDHENTPHVHHCLNYLRQLILCDANPTLEKVIMEISDRAVDLRKERVCRDWSKVWEVAEEGYEIWLETHPKNETSGEPPSHVHSRDWFL